MTTYQRIALAVTAVIGLANLAVVALCVAGAKGGGGE